MKKLLLVVAAALGASIVKKNLDRKTSTDPWGDATAPKADAPTPDTTGLTPTTN
ncbi:MAG: hypothetical protein IPH03_00880 [Tetrasphaera sp.]|jgi:hypothetical protein|nr:hypothetical protein [Tetrasphaera sp.]